jgi:preprotein translocase subunit SecD
MLRNGFFVSSLLTLSIIAAFAAERPQIEIHPVMDCSEIPGGVPLSNPQAQGRCLSPAIIVQGADFIGAFRGRNTSGDVLNLTLSDDAQQRFYRFTRARMAIQMAILIDGRTVALPLVIEPLKSTSIQISGLTTVQIDDIVERLHTPANGI